MKKYLVRFECVIGDYEHLDYYIFDKKKSEWGYCKEFWGIHKRDNSCLGDNQFWDNHSQNAISVQINVSALNIFENIDQRQLPDFLLSGVFYIGAPVLQLNC